MGTRPSPDSKVLRLNESLTCDRLSVNLNYNKEQPLIMGKRKSGLLGIKNGRTYEGEESSLVLAMFTTVTIFESS